MFSSISGMKLSCSTYYLEFLKNFPDGVGDSIEGFG